MMIALDVLIRSARELDPLPQSAARLASLLATDDWDIDEVVEIASFDQALTVRLLQAANSAASGSRAEITTLDAAVMRLGPRTVPALALGTVARKCLASALPAYGLAEGELWQHSVAAALATEELRSFVDVDIPPECFSAGLLHDVGKLVLARHLDAPLLRLVDEERRSGLTQLEAEQRVFEVDHSELAALVTREWGLPDCFEHAIAYHHEPWEAPPVRETTACHVLRVADLVSHAVLSTRRSGEPVAVEPVEERVLARLGLGADKVEALRDRVAQGLDGVLRWFA